MSVRAYEPGWADVLEDHAAEQETARRLVGQLGACEASALAFCRLLERWARGEPEPATPGRRQAALRRAADRVETALTGLEMPLGRYLLELEADQAEGRSWYGAPGAAELLEWEPILTRAGVHASAIRVAQTYLELAVFVRALTHHEVPHRTVRDVARDVGAVAARVDHVEVVGERLPLTPRHPDRKCGAGDVLDSFHHVDE